MGNLDLYRRLVKGFAKTQQNFAEQFAAVAQDTEQTIQVAHTLKGLAGNIGAKKLLAAANELEQALHNGLDTQAPLQQTMDELPLVLADIDLVVQQDEPPSVDTAKNSSSTPTCNPTGHAFSNW